MGEKNRQHLLRVEHPVVKFEKLIAAVRHEGLRVGWLDFPEQAPQIPSSLARAADFGVLRAVAVAEDRMVSVKPMRGAPVLRDLLREHFRGCALILVHGDVDAPGLRPAGDDWVVLQAAEERRWATAELVAALRRPRPWG